MTGTLVLHDYVTQRGGAERVALLLAERLGGGRLTTSVYVPEDTFPGFAGVEVTELLPGLPTRVKQSRAALAGPAAVAFLRHRESADAVLASSSGWSHWTSTPSPTVVYCHTPPRWFWAPHDYFSGLGRTARRAAASLGHPGRRHDRRRAVGHHRYLANSTLVQQRIQDAYGVEADVVFPPLAMDPTGAQEPVPGIEPGFVLTIARARGYKNVDLGRLVFAGGGLGQLVVVGGGASASPGERVVDTGRVSDAQLRWLYAHCRAVLALSHEDFGLTPVEGHAFGKPTIALRAGGYLDSCLEGENAVFVDELSEAAVRGAVEVVDRHPIDPATVAATAQRFTPDSFLAAVGAALDDVVR